MLNLNEPFKVFVDKETDKVYEPEQEPANSEQEYGQDSDYAPHDTATLERNDNTKDWTEEPRQDKRDHPVNAKVCSFMLRHFNLLC